MSRPCTGHRTIIADGCPSRSLERLEAEFPPEDVHTWLKPLQADLRVDSPVLYAPNAFIVDQVRELYLARIRELLAHFAGFSDVFLKSARARAL